MLHNIAILKFISVKPVLSVNTMLRVQQRILRPCSTFLLFNRANELFVRACLISAYDKMFMVVQFVNADSTKNDFHNAKHNTVSQCIHMPFVHSMYTRIYTCTK